MNIYEKLQIVRVALAEQGIKKGKTNTYSNYTYYELSDFLPQLMKLMKENKMASMVSFTPELATLTLIDAEKPDARIDFTTPMSTAKLKACHEVQNLGAVMTYTRRYLYIDAFEIAESDVLDANTGKPDTMGAAANTAAAPAVFTWNVNAKPFDELVRLWEFLRWDTKNLMAYIEGHGKRVGMAPGDILYQAIIKDNIAYAEQEAAKGNPDYIGKKFSDNVPF